MYVEVPLDDADAWALLPTVPDAPATSAGPARRPDGDREPGLGQRMLVDPAGRWALDGSAVLAPVKCAGCPRILRSPRSIRRGVGPGCERRRHQP